MKKNDVVIYKADIKKKTAIRFNVVEVNKKLNRVRIECNHMRYQVWEDIENLRVEDAN